LSEKRCLPAAKTAGAPDAARPNSTFMTRTRGTDG
jgi:hypothetical protein